jgi:hypothetical protein
MSCSAVSQTIADGLQAGEALCDVARGLPLPVILEHMVWPLLLSLTRGPDPAIAVVGIGRTLGGTLAARHLLPPLLALLASSGAVRSCWTGALHHKSILQHAVC